jgi:hypothetical protein
MTGPRVSWSGVMKGYGCIKLSIRVLAGAGLSLISLIGPSSAHHSFAMFDSDHPLELVGTLVQFKYTNPHTFIVLEVKNADGSSTEWSLEGGSPSALIRDGWTSSTIKPGDGLKITVKPLRSGAPGGAWDMQTITYQDGTPLPIKR